MQRCWSELPSNRPFFKQLKETIGELINNDVCFFYFYMTQ